MSPDDQASVEYAVPSNLAYLPDRHFHQRLCRLFFPAYDDALGKGAGPPVFWRRVQRRRRSHPAVGVKIVERSQRVLDLLQVL